MPAQAGIQFVLTIFGHAGLDSRLRGKDELGSKSAFLAALLVAG